MPNLTVTHTVLGHAGVRGEALPVLELSFPLDRITLDELIARTVERQIDWVEERAHARAGEARTLLDRCYLAAADIQAMAPTGRIGMPDRATVERIAPDIDVAREIARARAGFTTGQYRVFVDGQELIRLDETVSLAKVSSARFLRIVPLVGG